MEISPTYIQTKANYTKPAFGSIATGLATSKLRPELRGNFTYFGRYFYDMDRLVDKAIKLQARGDAPLEILVCGCSDGTKALEFQMGFIKRYKELGKSLEELPKIRAFDMNADMVNLAKNGRINVSNREIVNLHSMHPNLFKEFFIKEMPLLDVLNNDIKFMEDSLNTKYMTSFQYNPEWLGKIDFYQSDLLTELQKMNQDKYRFVSCENVAIYLPSHEQRLVAELLDKNLRPGSQVIVGDRDVHFTEFVSDEMLKSAIPNVTSEDKIKFWKLGLLTNPNEMVKTLCSLRFKKNPIISDDQCVYEKLCNPGYMNFYQKPKQ